jgi:hypothetical protein
VLRLKLRLRQQQQMLLPYLKTSFNTFRRRVKLLRKEK